MPITYDDGIAEGEECPECHSVHTWFDRAFGFWKCETCSTVWGSDSDDPDYDEVEDYNDSPIHTWGKLTPLMPHDQEFAIAELRRQPTDNEDFTERAIQLDKEEDDRTLEWLALKAKHGDDLDDIPF